MKIKVRHDTVELSSDDKQLLTVVLDTAQATLAESGRQVSEQWLELRERINA